MVTRNTYSLRALASISSIAVGAALLVTGSYEISHERILDNRRERLIRTLHEVLDPASHDNDLTGSRISVRDFELLGSAEPVDVFIATKQGQPVAALFSSVAPPGYNGPIYLLVGVLVDGTVSGVRVTSHNETPGLGDAIEIEKSNWILSLDGTSLMTPAEWVVSRENGSFDALTGATVTPRAVVDAVRKTLLYFQRHQQDLFREAKSETLSATDPLNE